MAPVDRQARRHEIVEAALRLCAQEGVQAVTTRRVSDAVGMTARTLGRSFHIEELTNAMTLASVDVVPTDEDIGLAPGASRNARIEALVHTILAALEGDPGRRLAELELRMLGVRSDTVAAGQVQRTLHDRIATILDLADDPPPHARARTIVALLDGLALTWITDREPIDRDLLVDIVRTVLDDGSAGAFVAVHPAPWDDPPPRRPDPLRAYADH